MDRLTRWVSACGEQEINHFGKAAFGSVIDRAFTVLIFQVDAGAVGEQHLHDHRIFPSVQQHREMVLAIREAAGGIHFLRASLGDKMQRPQPMTINGI
jgi:hypothetical protein